MNYETHYERLIARARVRELTGYRERHHVIPRCMGGDNSSSNIVNLTAEEHYVAHQLLVRINPKFPKLVHAAVLMSVRCSNNKAFGWLKRRNASAKRGVKMGPLSAATRAKLSAANKGRPLTVEHRAKLSDSRRGVKRSPETRKKISAALRVRVRKQESIDKTANAQRGKKRIGGWHHSAEAKMKIAIGLVGNKHNIGRITSPETKAKIAASMIGKNTGPLSAAHRAKISVSMKAALA